MLNGFDLRLSRSWQRMKAKINCQVIKQITSIVIFDMTKK